MLLEKLKKVASKSLAELGLQANRSASRNSLVGVLRQAKDAGFSPRTVVDIGAAYGSFASECFGVFPDSGYVLIEPLEEYRPFLEVVTQSIPTAEYILAAAAAEPGEVSINVHPDLVGSSQYLEDEDSDVNGIPRRVPAITLDSLLDDGTIRPPLLVKIDVQGAELDILLGGEKALRKTDFVILEVSLFEFFAGGPQFYDVMAFMKARGFVVYDIVGLQYRPLDNALSQVDAVFVKEAGSFRQIHFYATRGQRHKQNEEFKSVRRELMGRYGL